MLELLRNHFHAYTASLLPVPARSFAYRIPIMHGHTLIVADVELNEILFTTEGGHFYVWAGYCKEANMIVYWTPEEK